MTPLVNNIWELILEEYKKYGGNDSKLVFDASQVDNFKLLFESKYNHLKEKYMDKSVKHLDRHKVAALIIVSLLEVSPFSIQLPDDGQYISIANELIALKAGLAYMVQSLNKKLEQKNAKKQIETFVFPEAQSCSTSYMEIMCRNLYYAKRDFQLNPLDLAERLFLIEYISLIKSEINPDILKDY